jgi:hypothetical protein
MSDPRGQSEALIYGYNDPFQLAYPFFPVTSASSNDLFSPGSDPDILENFDFDAFLHQSDEPHSHIQQSQPTEGNARTWHQNASLANQQSSLPNHSSREQRQRFPTNVGSGIQPQSPPEYSTNVDRQRLTTNVGPTLRGGGGDEGVRYIQEAQATTASTIPSLPSRPHMVVQQTHVDRKENIPPSKSAPPFTRKPVEGECPVCWDPFLETQTILYCKTTCGNNFHKSCIVEWLTTPANRQHPLKCPMCRAPWDSQELKQLYQENGIVLPRPNKRFRPTPDWTGRAQDRTRHRHTQRQRVYDRRRSGPPVSSTWGSRADFSTRPIADQQTPSRSPNATTGVTNQTTPAPMAMNQLPPNGGFVQVSQGPRPPTHGEPQSFPNNGANPPYSHYHLQPPLAQRSPGAFQTQSNALYPNYSNMSTQNFQSANSMPAHGYVVQNRPQSIPAAPMQLASPTFRQHACPAMPRNQPQTIPTAPIQYNSPTLRQHPCPAMRQQVMHPMQLFAAPNNFVPLQPTPGSWEFHQQLQIQVNTHYMFHYNGNLPAPSV